MSDPLVRALKQVRVAHKVSQERVNECLDLSPGTYRHIESGRRKPPDFRHGLVKWVQAFEQCVEATHEERQRILEVLSHDILEQFSGLLRDLNDQGN